MKFLIVLHLKPKTLKVPKQLTQKVSIFSQIKSYFEKIETSTVFWNLFPFIPVKYETATDIFMSDENERQIAFLEKKILN